MNTIDTHKDGSTLNVTVYSPFNLHTKRMVESRVTQEVETLIINLEHCSLIDSEGVIFLHQWIDSGKSLQLIKPPEILFEILDILEINDAWNLEYIITN